jgi:hypothetical protein
MHFVRHLQKPWLRVLPGARDARAERAGFQILASCSAMNLAISGAMSRRHAAP